MKVAVASTDGESISRHFGRSACFIVYSVEDGAVIGHEIRQNRFTAHAQGQCHDGAGEGHEHSHSAIVQVLHDCDAVLCYGMGWRAAQDLEAAGVKAYVLEAECTPDEAVGQFAVGRLTPGGGFCQSHGQP